MLDAEPTTALLFFKKMLYVGTKAKKVVRLNADSGDVLGEQATEALPAGRLAIRGDSIYMFLEDREKRMGYVISVNTALTSTRWKQSSSPEWASERPHIWKGLIIAGNCRGEVASFRSSDGQPQWKQNVKGCIRSMGSHGDILFVGVQEGTVYAFGNTEGKKRPEQTN